MPISRRRFTRVAFLGALAAASVSGGAAVLNYLYPRNHDRRLTTLSIAADEVPAPGAEPLLYDEFGFYLVNLSDEDLRQDGAAVSRGLLALSTVCPHLRGECPVRWNPEHEYAGRYIVNGETVIGELV